MPQLVLIVDDERDLVATLEYNLQREGFDTIAANDGKGAIQILEGQKKPALVLLDLMLPDMPGTEVCKSLRSVKATRDIPVIMLTAKSEEIDRVVGFELGADDYVVKPFSMRELIMRVRAVLRRAKAKSAPNVEQLGAETLRVDLAAHRVFVGEQETVLTALEFKLLRTLLERRGRVQSRERLLEDVWGITADITTRTVDTHVKRLRRKLGSAGEMIETLRGVGYRFRDDVSC